ncbi:hypothetical protein AVEN_202179-1, partial [Araneus ventricosus]
MRRGNGAKVRNSSDSSRQVRNSSDSGFVKLHAVRTRLLHSHGAMLGTFHIRLAKSHAVGTRLLHSHGANAWHLSHQTRQVTRRGNKAFTFPRRECVPPFTSDSPSHTPWEQGFYIPTARMLGT